MYVQLTKEQNCLQMPLASARYRSRFCSLSRYLSSNAQAPGSSRSPNPHSAIRNRL